MTFSPAPLSALTAYWKSQGGTPLGVVGDAAHQARASYHNGQDAITRHGRTAVTDYSIRHPRDQEPHLTNAAAAIDLGRLNGSLVELQRFSNWIVAACIRDPDVRRDIREIIYSPDGKIVQRYSAPDNAVRVGGGDDSHLWHTHISFYRDSEKRAKVPLFEPFFELPDTGTGEVMGDSFNADYPPTPGTAKTTVAIGIIPTEGGPFTNVPVGYVRNVVTGGVVTSGRYAGRRAYLVANPDGAPPSMGYLLASAATFTPLSATRSYPVTVTIGGDTVTGSVTLP